MDIQPGSLQNADQLYAASSCTPPPPQPGGSPGDSVELRGTPETTRKAPLFSTPAAKEDSPSVQELSSHSLQMAPLPAVSGQVLQSLGSNILGWFRGAKSDSPAPAGAPAGAPATPARSQSDIIAETLAAPLGDSTPEQRRALFDTIMKMIIRTEGGNRGSYQGDEALEQYQTISKWLHKGQSFKEFAELYGFISENVDLHHAPMVALDYVNNKLYGKKEEQQAYLAILDNTWDPWETEKFLKEVNKVSLKHKWEDRRDAMVALTSAIGRRVVDCFAPKKKLVAIEAFRMLKKHLKEGETIKDAAVELQVALEEKRNMSGYSDFILRGIAFSAAIREENVPPAERKLLMRAFSRFGNSYGPVEYARQTLALVKEPVGNSSFDERDRIVRDLMDRDYEPEKVLGSYKAIREATGSDETMPDVAKAFLSFRDLTWSADEAKKALLYSRNVLKKDGKETEFFTSLLKYTRDAERARGFYEALAAEPLLEKQIQSESRDDRRGIMRDLISWYMESENYKSPRHGSKMEVDKVMESVREDYRTIGSLTKPGESPLIPTAKFTTYISMCHTVHFAKEARKALTFTRKDLRDDPREVGYFDALQEKCVWADQAVERYKAFAGLAQLQQPIGSETLESRRDLFMSRLLRHTSWETPKCISLALNEYDLITRNLNPGETLEQAGKRIDGWMEKSRTLTTLKEHTDSADAVTLLSKLREPGESLDQTLSRTMPAIEALEKKPPYNGFDDMWFTDFTRPIYLGLTFLADSLQSGALGDISPKQAFDDLMTLLSHSNYIDKIKELMLSRASLSKPEEEKTRIQRMDDQVIIDGIKLDMRQMNKIGVYLPAK